MLLGSCVAACWLFTQRLTYNAMLCISRDCLDNITEVVLSSRESLYILCLLIMCIFMTICRTYFTLCIICWHEIHSLLTSSGVLLKMEVGIRKRVWQTAWRYRAYLSSLRWVYAVKKTPEVGIRRIPAYTPQYTTAHKLLLFSSFVFV